jgi:hypothetical protein
MMPKIVKDFIDKAMETERGGIRRIRERAATHEDPSERIYLYQVADQLDALRDEVLREISRMERKGPNGGD